jgi:beta-fructofuranosidase
VQQPNGELGVRVPASVSKAFNKPLRQELKTAEGNSLGLQKQVKIKAQGKFNAVMGGVLPDTCKLSTSVIFTENTKDFGCMLRCSDDLENAYYIRLEPWKNRMVFDMWPRTTNEVSQMVELERSLKLTPGKPLTMQVFIDGNKGVAYVNDLVAMNFRAYNLKEGKWAFFVSQGSAIFSNMEVSTL